MEPLKEEKTNKQKKPPDSTRKNYKLKFIKVKMKTYKSKNFKEIISKTYREMY